MSLSLSQILNQYTTLPLDLLDIVKLCNLDNAISAANGDFKKLSTRVQKQIKQNGSSVTELNIYSVNLTKEIAEAIFQAFPNLKQLTVQQETLTIERVPHDEPRDTLPYKIEYISEASFQRDLTVAADEDSFISSLIEELNTDRGTSHGQYSVVITLPSALAAFR